ncbi:MAG: hypothetical protein GX970_04620 [Phyllobacteriaceae bacterium]|nr:hypothetical protein [Phyllobacteriaceae bacterium]
MSEDAEALRLVFLEKMLETSLAKAEILRRMETTPVHHLDRIYSALQQVRKVRRKLISLYRQLSRNGGNEPT